MPLIIAHRGASHAHRENTLEAFRAASEMGADAVELDARPTADGTIIVHHDPVLVDGRVICELDCAELPPEIPTLVDALVACGDLVINVEVKNESYEPDFDEDRRLAAVVLELLAPYSVDRLLVSSFDAEMVDRVRALAPDMPTAQLVFIGNDEAAYTKAAEAGHVAFHPMAGTFDAETVNRCHDLGLAVNTWTVDDPEQMQDLAKMGVDGIVTNQPDKAKDLFKT